MEKNENFEELLLRNVTEVAEEEICISAWASAHMLLNRATGQVLPINCKSWRCPKHRKSWFNKWRTVVSRETSLNPVNKLVTLTCASRATPAQLTLARQLLLREIRKTTEFEYLSVLEFTSLTRLPHLHLLVRCPKFIPNKILSALWRVATSTAGIKPSYITKIEKPHSQDGAAYYALSYALSLDKNQDIPLDWKGRKITYSKGFFSKPVAQHWAEWKVDTFGGDVSRETTENAIWEVFDPRFRLKIPGKPPEFDPIWENVSDGQYFFLPDPK